MQKYRGLKTFEWATLSRYRESGARGAEKSTNSIFWETILFVRSGTERESGNEKKNEYLLRECGTRVKNLHWGRGVGTFSKEKISTVNQVFTKFSKLRVREKGKKGKWLG